MGFFKFLKRDKKKDSLEELDLPPAPPPLEGFDESMPELPEFPELEGEKISAPEQPANFGADDGAAGFPKDTDMPDFSDFNMPQEQEMQFPEADMRPQAPDTYEPPKEIPIPEHEDIAPKPSLMQEPEHRMRGRLFSPERVVKRDIKTAYVKVDEFKAVLGSISIVRRDMKKTEESLAKLESLKTSKDRSVDKIKASLDDLQRKLIFIDKTLFKGEQA